MSEKFLRVGDLTVSPSVVRYWTHQRIPLNSEERSKRLGEYPYYGANGIQGYIDDFIFDGDAILVAEDGGNFDQYAERPIAQWVTGKYWVNNHAHILRAKENDLDKWIFYSLVHKEYSQIYQWMELERS